MNYSTIRAAQERAAAESAMDPRARRCHEQLARLHSDPSRSRLGDGDGDEPACSPLFIVIR